MKTLLVYIHLMAACVAVGILLMEDLALAKARGKTLSLRAISELKQAASIISLSLIVLWISGLTLVLVGYLDNPQEYLMNQKLWAKFTVVIILTLNGLVLHHFSFPRIASNRGILGLGNVEKALVMLSGCVSTTSWLFACYLGIARSWNYTADYSFVIFLYLGLLGIACIFGSTMISNRNPWELSRGEKFLAILCASISAFSWLFASYLLVTHPWIDAAESSLVMLGNLGLLGIVCVLGCIVIHSLCSSKEPDIHPRSGREMLREPGSFTNSIPKS